MSEPVPDGAMTVESILKAELLLAAYENQSPEFGDWFVDADRLTLAAVITYAALAMRELAVRDNAPLPTIRRRLRAQVVDAVANTHPNGDNK